MSDQRQKDIKEAGMRSRSAMAWLRDQRLPADPICYTVAYEYLFTQNERLKTKVESVDCASEHGKEEIEKVYKEEIIAANYEQLSMQANNVEKYVSEALSLLLKSNPDNEEITSAVKTIKTAMQNTAPIKTDNAATAKEKIKQGTAEASDSEPCYLGIMADAERDPKTGVLTAIGLTQTLKSAFSQVENFPLSIIKIDIDQFKLFTNTNGTIMGDAVLKHLAKLFTNNLKGSDIISRDKIDEFVIVLPRCGVSNAVNIADMLRKKTEGVSLKKKGSLTPVKVTISAGVSEFNGSGSFDMSLSKAQKALHRSKDLGRNCVNRES